MPDAHASTDAAYPHAEAPGGLPIVEKPLRAMHLAQAFPAEHGAAASHVKREVAAQVLDRRAHASGWVDHAVVCARRRHLLLSGRRPRENRREPHLLAARRALGGPQPPP